MTLLFVFLISFFGFNGLSHAEPLKIDEAYGKVITECGVKGSKQHVWIFKQWHLSPEINTQKNPSHPLPQEANQTAIYTQLAHWAEQKKVKTIISEGCTGEITDSFKKEFNGWGLKELRGLTTDDSYPKIVTLVPLKLKAKFKDGVKVYCGDDDHLIKTENVALSDARGTVGFLSQIIANRQNPAKAKAYLQRAIALDHLPADSSVDKVVKALRADLQDDVKKILDGIEDRNQKFFEAIKNHGTSDSALVIGGLHAPGLVELLKKNQIDCSVVQPVGYDEKDEKVIDALKEM